MNESRPQSGGAPAWLLALGRRAPPERVVVAGRSARLAKTFKHDFFAFTALFAGDSSPFVLKISRNHALCGIPMRWAGKLLRDQEVRLYRLTESIEGIPNLVGELGETGFAHEYIEGHPLSRDDRPDDDFFPRLSAILDALHALDIAYVDLEKPENILVSAEGRPFLFDFQISWYLRPNRGGRTWLARRILGVLQTADRYHLDKHWRRFRPDQFEGLGTDRACEPPIWIRWHRAVFRPMTLLRRQVLVWMGVRDSIKVRSPG